MFKEPERHWGRFEGPSNAFVIELGLLCALMLAGILMQVLTGEGWLFLLSGTIALVRIPALLKRAVGS